MVSPDQQAALDARLQAGAEYLHDDERETVERALEMAAVLVESTCRSHDWELARVAPYCAERLTELLRERSGGKVKIEVLPAAFEERLLRVRRMSHA